MVWEQIPGRGRREENQDRNVIVLFQFKTSLNNSRDIEL